MNIHEFLLLIKGEDSTESVNQIYFKNNICFINFKGFDKQYPYKKDNIIYLTNPKKININDVIVKDKHSSENINCILQFSNFLRVIYLSGDSKLMDISDVVILNNAEIKGVYDNLTYFKTLSEKISEVEQNEISIISDYFSDIKTIDENTILYDYLLGKIANDIYVDKKDYIFPFSCNLSQIDAVSKALTNKVTVIEGPPGTGKTQTILNLIANLVVDNKTFAIVSNNNSATENVATKLSRSGFDFLLAPLGKSENKDSFINTKQIPYPDFDSYTFDSEYIKDIKKKNIQDQEIIKTIFSSQNRILKLKKELNDILVEKNYFNEYLPDKDINYNLLARIKKLSSEKILKLWLEFESFYEDSERYGLYFKIKNIFKYKLFNLSFYTFNHNDIIIHLQKYFYIQKEKEILNDIKTLESSIKSFDIEEMLKEFSSLSMSIFKDSIYQKYKNKERRKFTKLDLYKNPNDVIKEYPVILSTTHSIKKCIGDNFIYDYIIIDEASQVDLLTGMIALSSAKHAIILGDSNQLSPIIKRKISDVVNKTMRSFNVNDNYNYSKHSILTSIKGIFENIPKVILKEHYRCHPKIIEFCNKKFYNNELIIMTKDYGEPNVLKAITTVAGNHARGNANQREFDVITQTVLPDLLKRYSKDDIGIVTPYKNHKEMIDSVDITSNINVSTVHKFQGQERDVIIITTVDNQITDFTDNPNMLNVAVSRAKKEVVLVTTGNKSDKNLNINDFLKYIEYNNFSVTESNIRSIFDLLYNCYSEERYRLMQNYKIISKFPSENIMYNELLQFLRIKGYENTSVVCHQPLNIIIKDKSKLTDDELHFVTNSVTHIDFVLYNIFDKQLVLCIEVDGVQYHKKGSRQEERDNMKNSILERYGIKLIRIKTTDSYTLDRVEKELGNSIKKVNDINLD